jgi:radical SAM superfamily enzyme YgiQ (UPF0313 family)
MGDTETAGEMMDRVKLVGINGRFTHSSLALFYVRNELQKHCPSLKSELLQFTINDNYYEMVLRLSDQAPRYIFFSAAIWNSDLVEKLIVDLKKCLPGTTLVVGGPQATVIGERVGTDLCTVVLGEVEAVGEEFYSHLRSGLLQKKYGSSFFKLKNPDFSYPYTDTDFETELKNRYVYYESSKGCPFGCTYCLSSAEKGLFHKDVAAVKKELRHILSHSPKVVRFIDRTYNDIPSRALAIWEFLVAEGGETLFHFEMAPDRFTEEMFVFLQTLEPGKFQFEIGIQSFNMKTLEAVNRKIEAQTSRESIKRLAAFGNIHLHVDLILGLPYETKESFAETFRSLFELGSHYIQMGLLKILPDTPLSGSIEEYGYHYSACPPYSVLSNNWMSHATIADLYWFSECVEKFVNNRYFVSLWKYLRDSGEDMYLFFCRVLEVCRGAKFFQLAPTHELMSQMIVKIADIRDDCEVIIELLRYDWLRCNHRFLPECLKVPEGTPLSGEIRSELYQSMPQDLEGVYERKNRNHFFRKSFFLRISKKTAKIIGISVHLDPACCCFLGEREGGLHDFNKVLIL